MSHRIATVVGARPQFIKAATVSRALATLPSLTEHLIHTGQHFDDNMSEVFFRELAIPAPHYHLNVHGGGHGQMTGRMLEALEAVLVELAPDLVLVYGDTNSTLAGALAAAKLHIPVAHVEAGLRSFNRRMPEEVNRVLVDHVSALLFCPTHEAIANLAREGIVEGVHHTGDVMFDATFFARAAALTQAEVLQRHGLVAEHYVLCTLHRSENTEDETRLRALVEYVRECAQGEPVVFPVHPRTRLALARFRVATPGFVMLDPAGYFDLHRLLSGARLVMTDSGGLQKEAYFHRVPCVTLRDETEWTETLAAGWNRLWTCAEYAQPRTAVAEYGDGHAASLMVNLIAQFLAA